MPDLAERIAELEARITFQDDSLHALNAVIARQDRELLALRQELASQLERLKGLANAVEAGPVPSEADERPPHY